MSHYQLAPSDAALLQLLTADQPPISTSRKFARRDAALDPLLLAAAAASGPHMTRNHYAHDFFPGVQVPEVQGKMDFSQWSGQDAVETKDKHHRRAKAKLTYVSRQAPRRERLGLADVGVAHAQEKENDLPSLPHEVPDKKQRRASLSSSNKINGAKYPSSEARPTVEVKCMARTRIPTPHGPVFLHLYHNNRDSKEHLALVTDPAQLAEPSSSSTAPSIRSASLDARWSETETDADRLLRGAYVGRLSQTSQIPSSSSSSISSPDHAVHSDVPAPLIRIHSECFTGETIGSMRCDCGEQLDEAMRQIAQPIPMADRPHMTIPGRGAVIYMRQEGRGIGLLEKIKAYNLQDMGHDTVSANLMLGHKADERGYEVAAAILRDLGLGSQEGQGVRVLTNNPDKLQHLEKEGISIVERVPMIPRSWQKKRQVEVVEPVTPPTEPDVAGATMIGGNAVSGPDLDKYLRTKVLRMGHILPLWLDGSHEPALI